MAASPTIVTGAATVAAKQTTKSMFDLLCCRAEDEPEGGHNVKKVDAKQGIRCCDGAFYGVCCNTETISIVNSRSENLREPSRTSRSGHATHPFAASQFKQPRVNNVNRVKSDPGSSKPLGMEQRSGQYKHGQQPKSKPRCKDAKEPGSNQYHPEPERSSDAGGD